MTQTASTPTVRTRIAPSPTGEFHIGGLSMLLKNYAFAKKHDGQFILRIEDTDQNRLVEGATERLKEVIHDYGLDWDEGPDKGGPHAPYTQSQRLEIYRQKAAELVKAGKAYHCFCSKERLKKLRADQRAAKKLPRYDRHCLELSADEVKARLEAGEPSVIRLKVPRDQTVAFADLIRGQIKVASNELDDQVLLKSDGFPTYHLAVVVDDHLMKISHIMRGEEWISSTPKHILLYQAFGWESPIYAHIPVLLNPSGKGKMSKRQGAVSARSFLERGYLPEALLNFLMILGWTPKDQREIMTLEEYIEEFEPTEISAKSVVFDLDKLKWMNGVYIRQLSLAELSERIEEFLPTDFPREKLDLILPLVHERLETLAQVEDLTSFIYRPIKPKQKVLLKRADAELVTKQLELSAEVLAEISAWSIEKIEHELRALQEEYDWHRGQYFMMLRTAVTGRKVSPPLFETIHALDRELALKRLTEAKQLAKE